jgi:uncharacterized protein YraI
MHAPVIALVLALAWPAGAAAFDAMTTGAVNVRSGAGTEFKRLATLPRGTPVAVDRCDEGWCAIKADEVSGWVSARYLAGLEPTSDGGVVTTYRSALARCAGDPAAGEAARHPAQGLSLFRLQPAASVSASVRLTRRSGITHPIAPSRSAS